MRFVAALIFFLIVTVQTGTAQSGEGFLGVWKLNSSRSEVTGLPTPPDAVLHVSQQSSASFTYWTGQGGEGGAAVITRFPLDGKLERREVGGFSQTLSGKWEGATLLTTAVVGGPQKYTVTERWRESRDGQTLTISRTIVRPGGDREFVLVYERPGTDTTPEVSKISPEERPAQSPVESRPAILRPSRATPPPAVALKEPDYKEPDYVVESGTHILLRLTNALNTKHSQPGDKVYLETAVPVYVDQRLVIPRGSYVIGMITESERAGRVKGKSSLNLRFESLTLPNGITRNFSSRAGSVDGHGNVDRKEGRIEGEGNKSGDAATIGKTTAAGAGVGTIAGAATGHYGMGAGIGAAAGAAAGLAGVLLCAVRM